MQEGVLALTTETENAPEARLKWFAREAAYAGQRKEFRHLPQPDLQKNGVSASGFRQKCGRPTAQRLDAGSPNKPSLLTQDGDVPRAAFTPSVNQRHSKEFGDNDRVAAG